MLSLITGRVCMLSENKIEKLQTYLKNLNNAAVAFSAGVDSSFLLKIAKNIPGLKVIAITAASSLLPEKELNDAIDFCKQEKIKHIIFDFDCFGTHGFKVNPINRCYLCKKELFKQIKELAAENNIENVLDGSNADDDNDYRPGLKALTELAIKSPLKYAGLNKEEIRFMAEKMNIKSWNKPSFACLASRIAYGEEITREKLHMIESAELFLSGLSFSQLRVRVHRDIARIEVPEEQLDKLLNNREAVVSELKKIGFKYVTMDLSGYRTGSMNEIL